MQLQNSLATLFVLAGVFSGPTLATQDLGRVKPLSLRAVAGSKFRVFPDDRERLTVVVFTGTGCPISNSYAPVYSDLVKAFPDVRFLAVNAVDDDVAAVAAHAREYAFPCPVLLDPEHRAVGMFDALVTPEAFLVDGGGRIRYRGRIDDRWASRTAKREAARVDDLRLAIAAVAAGRAVPVERTQGYGCAISRREKSVATTDLTYHRDIEPILQRSCQECHRAGQVGPFELMTYEDAESWGDELVEFTRERLMPPWLASGPHGRFKDDRRLPQKDIDAIAAWVSGGMPKGDPKDAPAPVAWPAGWSLGKPDLVLEMTEEHRVAPDGPDEYMCFVVPTGLSKDTWVKAAEFQAGNTRVVHHMIGYLDNQGRARKLDKREPGPGYHRFGGPGFLPSGSVGGWAPGNVARFLPHGVARLVRKNSDLVLQMHYYKSGKVETDRSRVALYFAKEKITHRVVPLVTQGGLLRIPAGAKNHRVEASLRLPMEAEVFDALPHMHLLGKKIRLTAELPSGEIRELIRIDNWDFNWQLTYEFAEPQVLPKGTLLTVTAFYDNSASNPRNPSSPPKPVFWGEETTDEMCYVFLHAVQPIGGGAGMFGLLRNLQRRN